MNKDKEVEVVDLIEKVEDLTILCKIRENINGRMIIKKILSGKVVILTKVVLVLTVEQVILILEVVFVVIVLDVVKKGTDPLNVNV